MSVFKLKNFAKSKCFNCKPKVLWCKSIISVRKLRNMQSKILLGFSLSFNLGHYLTKCVPWCYQYKCSHFSLNYNRIDHETISHYKTKKNYETNSSVLCFSSYLNIKLRINQWIHFTCPLYDYCQLWKYRNN